MLVRTRTLAPNTTPLLWFVKVELLSLHLQCKEAQDAPQMQPMRSFSLPATEEGHVEAGQPCQTKVLEVGAQQMHLQEKHQPGVSTHVVFGFFLSKFCKNGLLCFSCFLINV